jgi:single-stranded-DNA-specific exonuclease
VNNLRPWVEPQDIFIPADLLEAAGGSSLAAQALLRRGIISAAAVQSFIDPESYTPAAPEELPGLEQVVERLEAALLGRQQICIWGDFDVDGQTSTALLVSALRELGGHVSWYIPVRERESHGVHLDSLERVIDQGAQIVLTCDTGSSAQDAAEYAKSRGVELLISDHHELPEKLPQAPLVNPRLLPPEHPLAALPGVGVAYKLAEALFRRASRSELARPLLDLTALGIVADVALLKGDTRWLLQKGLQVLRSNRRPAFQAMLEFADVQSAGLTEEHLGFILGPRLNALGRLSDANTAVELLTTPDLGRARILAVQLEGLNARRKLLTDQVFLGALSQVERDPSLLEYAALVLSHPGWPAGVIGIVASRLVERYQRPVVLLSAPEGQPGRGSARSVEGCHITQAIAAQANLLIGFGGHPMAAGLSLEAVNIPEFRRRLSESVAEMRKERIASGLEVDAIIALPDATLELAEDLSRLAPFGPGNPSITLASRNLSLKSHTSIGRSGDHLQMIVEDESGHSRKVLWWGGAGWPLPEGRFDLAFHLRPTSYRGTRQVQFEWVETCSRIETIVVESKPKRSVVDLRRQPQPLLMIKELIGQNEVQIWREGEAVQALQQLGLDGRDRYELTPYPGLLIWTSPPGPQELTAVLEMVKPEIIYLCSVAPEAGHFVAFLKRMAGLVKYAINEQGGRAKITRLASASAQREAAVSISLIWLEQRGLIKILEETNQEVLLSPGPGQGSPSPEITALLKSILEETAAYREYFVRMDKDRLK